MDAKRLATRYVVHRKTTYLVLYIFLFLGCGVTATAQTIIFTGDILLDRGVRAAIDSAGIEHLFSPEIDSLFRSADAVVGNLECPATDIHRPVHKIYIFRAEPDWLHTLRRHGITHLNLANNHTIDQGRIAMMDTRRNVLQAGIIPIGADSTMAAAVQPVRIFPPFYRKEPCEPSSQKGEITGGFPPSEKQNQFSLSSPPLEGSGEVFLLSSVRLPLENFSYLPHRPSPSQEPFDTLCARVTRLRQQKPEAIIIVSLHWGEEHALTPRPQQVVEAHQLIDAGADALICHHTHTLQSIETYHGKPIYYSLGNFIFDPQRPINRRAAIVALDITPPTLSFRTIPIYIEGCTPRILKE